MDSRSTMDEYISGCESGWTVYFEQSRGYVDDQGCVNRSAEEDEEEEDLSMVSDASSRPAQVSQDSQNYANSFMNEGLMFYSVSTDDDAALVRNTQQKRGSKKARKGEKRVDSDQDQMLDDTASSTPNFNYSSMDYFSTSYCQGDASSSAIYSPHYDQVHFHQQYNW